jgi:hypothetical protein
MKSIVVIAISCCSLLLGCGMFLPTHYEVAGHKIGKTPWRLVCVSKPIVIDRTNRMSGAVDTFTTTYIEGGLDRQFRPVSVPYFAAREPWDTAKIDTLRSWFIRCSLPGEAFSDGSVLGPCPDNDLGLFVSILQSPFDSAGLVAHPYHSLADYRALALVASRNDPYWARNLDRLDQNVYSYIVVTRAEVRMASICGPGGELNSNTVDKDSVTCSLIQFRLCYADGSPSKVVTLDKEYPGFQGLHGDSLISFLIETVAKEIESGDVFRSR